MPPSFSMPTRGLKEPRPASEGFQSRKEVCKTMLHKFRRHSARGLCDVYQIAHSYKARVSRSLA